LRNQPLTIRGLRPYNRMLSTLKDDLGVTS